MRGRRAAKRPHRDRRAQRHRRVAGVRIHRESRRAAGDMPGSVAQSVNKGEGCHVGLKSRLDHDVSCGGPRGSAIDGSGARDHVHRPRKRSRRGRRARGRHLLRCHDGGFHRQPQQRGTPAIHHDPDPAERRQPGVVHGIQHRGVRICARGSQALCDRDGRIFFCDDRRQRSGSVMWTPRGLFHHS